MPAGPINQDVSLRYTLTLEDGTLVSRNAEGDNFDYAPGQEQIMPVLEEALRGMDKGEKRRIVLSPSHDHDVRLDGTRLALLLGRPGEVLVLDVEIL